MSGQTGIFVRVLKNEDTKAQQQAAGMERIQ